MSTDKNEIPDQIEMQIKFVMTCLWMAAQVAETDCKKVEDKIMVVANGYEATVWYVNDDYLEIKVEKDSKEQLIVRWNDNVLLVLNAFISLITAGKKTIFSNSIWTKLGPAMVQTSKELEVDGGLSDLLKGDAE